MTFRAGRLGRPLRTGADGPDGVDEGSYWAEEEDEAGRVIEGVQSAGGDEAPGADPQEAEDQAPGKQPQDPPSAIPTMAPASRWPDRATKKAGRW